MNFLVLPVYIAVISLSAAVGYAFGRDNTRSQILDKLHVDTFDVSRPSVHVGKCAFSSDGKTVYCPNIKEHPQAASDVPASTITPQMLENLGVIGEFVPVTGSINSRSPDLGAQIGAAAFDATTVVRSGGEDPEHIWRAIQVDKNGHVLCAEAK